MSLRQRLSHPQAKYILMFQEPWIRETINIATTISCKDIFNDSHYELYFFNLGRIKLEIVWRTQQSINDKFYCLVLQTVLVRD